MIFWISPSLCKKQTERSECRRGWIFFHNCVFCAQNFLYLCFFNNSFWNQLTSFSVLRVSLTRLSKLYSFFFNRSYPKHEMQIVDIGFGVVIIKLKQHAADFLFLPSWDKFVRQPRGSAGWFFFTFFKRGTQELFLELVQNLSLDVLKIFMPILMVPVTKSLMQILLCQKKISEIASEEM